MQIDISELKKRSKYITCVKHPTLDLYIWNYNPSCQYDRAWDEYTIQCRGLITDGCGTIIARPFKKFFNVNEREDTQIYKLPKGVIEVREKLDGILGIQYYDGDKVCIATRGTFTSPFALWATEWMQKQMYTRTAFAEGYTYLYEIIYPEGRILIDYRRRSELVLLAVISNENGWELDIDEHGMRLGLSVPECYQYNNLYEVVFDAKQLSGNKEGYVVQFENNLRVKVKGDEYTRTQIAVMHCSSTAIWEILKAGGSIDVLLDHVPDEVLDWVVEKAESLKSQYATLQREIKCWLVATITLNVSRKEQAEYVLQHLDKGKAALVFMALDGKDISSKLWDMIKPEFEKPKLAKEF